jgi:hypothetical protein
MLPRRSREPGCSSVRSPRRRCWLSSVRACVPGAARRGERCRGCSPTTARNAKAPSPPTARPSTFASRGPGRGMRGRMASSRGCRRRSIRASECRHLCETGHTSATLRGGMCRRATRHGPSTCGRTRRFRPRRFRGRLQHVQGVDNGPRSGHHQEETMDSDRATATPQGQKHVGLEADPLSEIFVWPGLQPRS